MRIEKVDFFYLSMPTVTLEEDGSQDVLLVRVLAGGFEGWGECEASPLVSIAAYCTPRSHGACRPVSDAVLGADLNSPLDIERVNQKVRQLSLDLLQADHTLSGIDVALWDLLGRKESAPVWSLMGAAKNLPKRPYASVLFGDSPEETARKAKEIRTAGFSAAKFGWNGFGTHELERDEKQLGAARQGLGENADLMVDVGTVWIDDVRMASERANLVPAYRVTWLEEPFLSAAPGAYGELADRVPEVPLAGGEGSHNFRHGETADRLREDCLRSNRRGPHRRADHRPPDSSICEVARGEVCEPQLHFQPGALRLAPGLCGSGRE